MRSILWLLAALALLLGIALVVFRGDSETRWSTTSEAAREDFEAGLIAMDKLYATDAINSFAQAAETDPDFLMPKVWLILMRRYSSDHRDETQTFVEDLRNADLDPLTARERMLARHVLAVVDRDHEEAGRIVDRYVEEHPEDPFGVRMYCGRVWEQQMWDEARACYQRLAEIAPNQVEAQNRLGYIDMAQGRFAEAEAQFEIYRYLAPDQANPHDSMGELNMVLGRYDEAEAELRRAVALKSDFCASWRNLVTLEQFRGDFDRAVEVQAEVRAAQGCPEEALKRQDCAIELWRQAAEGRWQEAWDASRACTDEPVDAPVAYLAAAAAGDTADLDQRIAKLMDESVEGGGDRGPFLEHLLALRELSKGDAEAAAEHGQAADAALRYWSGDWSFKLYNRYLTVVALERAGRSDEAAALTEEVRTVNPRIVDDFPFVIPEFGGASG